MGREANLWSEIDRLVATRNPYCYDQAVRLLVDLRDLAARGKAGDFQMRVDALRQAHTRKSAFIERLGKAGL